MVDIDPKFYQKKKSHTFYMALGFLIFVILVTGALYIYKGSIESQNNDIRKNIDSLSVAVANLKNNPDIQVYSMYEQNKVYFEKLSEHSQIPSFIAHLKKHFAKHGLEAKGFDYQNGKVNVNISSQTNDSGFAYQKIVNFLKEYPLEEGARFTIDPVGNFSGYDRINYSGTFTLK